MTRDSSTHPERRQENDKGAGEAKEEGVAQGNVERGPCDRLGMRRERVDRFRGVSKSVDGLA